MKGIKIIFFDIDGTLVDMSKKQISEKMLETLYRLKEKKIIMRLQIGRLRWRMIFVEVQRMMGFIFIVWNMV